MVARLAFPLGGDHRATGMLFAAIVVAEGEWPVATAGSHAIVPLEIFCTPYELIWTRDTDGNTQKIVAERRASEAPIPPLRSMEVRPSKIRHPNPQPFEVRFDQRTCHRFQFLDTDLR